MHTAKKERRRSPHLVTGQSLFLPHPLQQLKRFGENPELVPVGSEVRGEEHVPHAADVGEEGLGPQGVTVDTLLQELGGEGRGGEGRGGEGRGGGREGGVCDVRFSFRMSLTPCNIIAILSQYYHITQYYCNIIISSYHSVLDLLSLGPPADHGGAREDAAERRTPRERGLGRVKEGGVKTGERQVPVIEEHRV